MLRCPDPQKYPKPHKLPNPTNNPQTHKQNQYKHKTDTKKTKVVEQQSVKANAKDIDLYDFKPPSPLPPQQRSDALRAAGDGLMSAALGREGGAGRLLCALHTHTSRVEEEQDAAMSEVGVEGCGCWCCVGGC